MSILSRNAVRASVLVVAGCLARPAAADPVVITSGSVEVQILSSLARMSIAGEDFASRWGLTPSGRLSPSNACPAHPAQPSALAGRSCFRAAQVARSWMASCTHIFVDGMTGTFTTPSAAGHGHEHDAFLGSVFFLRHGQRLHERSVQRAERPGIQNHCGRRNQSATFIYYGGEGGPFFTATDLRVRLAKHPPCRSRRRLCSAAWAQRLRRAGHSGSRSSWRRDGTQRPTSRIRCSG